MCVFPSAVTLKTKIDTQKDRGALLFRHNTSSHQWALLTLYFPSFHRYITDMGNKQKSSKQLCYIWVLDGWRLAACAAAGHSAALSILPAVVGSQSVLMAAIDAQSMVPLRGWTSEQSSHPATQPAAEERDRGDCQEELLLCRSSFPTAGPCSQSQPFVTVRSHSFRDT